MQKESIIAIQILKKRTINIQNITIMKKLFVIIFVCLSPLVMSAQSLNSIKPGGSWSLPDQEKYLLLKFDFSETVFEKKYNETDWAILKGKEAWEEAKQEALDRIVNMMNAAMTKTRVIIVQEKMLSSESPSVIPNYTLYIAPQTYYSKGKNKSLFVLKNNKSGEIIGSVKTEGIGGHFGSLGNLLGDAFEHSGPQVAKLIAKNNKLKK